MIRIPRYLIVVYFVVEFVKIVFKKITKNLHLIVKSPEKKYFCEIFVSITPLYIIN